MRSLKTIYTCFPEGKCKVLTMSYDDGFIFDRRLVEIFNKYGIKGTFHINSGMQVRKETEPERRVAPDEMAELYKGHEVSAHTLTHPTIARCPLSQVVLQIIEDKRLIEEAVGYPVRGMSYPNGSYNEDIKQLLPSCGIEYARIVGNSDSFGMPTDYLEWKATCHHNHDLMENAKSFADITRRTALKMMYVWGHSYEFDRDDNWELIENFCEFIGGREDIWYATNIEIVDYMNAANNLKYTVNGDMVYNPSAISVWIEVDGQIYEIRSGEQKRIK